MSAELDKAPSYSNSAYSDTKLENFKSSVYFQKQTRRIANKLHSTSFFITVKQLLLIVLINKKKIEEKRRRQKRVEYLNKKKRINQYSYLKHYLNYFQQSKIQNPIL